MTHLIVAHASLSLDGAETLANLALAEAKTQNLNICVAIVDRAGHLLLFKRMDLAGLVSVDVAIGKARTAALFGKPTAVYETMINQGAMSMLSVPHTTPLTGGLPVKVDDKLIAAIGVSGATGAQDEAVAKAALHLFSESA